VSTSGLYDEDVDEMVLTGARLTVFEDGRPVVLVDQHPTRGDELRRVVERLAGEARR